MLLIPILIEKAGKVSLLDHYNPKLYMLKYQAHTELSIDRKEN